MLSLDNAIEAIRAEHVNVQLEFSTDVDGYLLYNLRILPWRNNPRQGYMIMVADHTLSSCLIMAAEDLQANRWAVLNWRVQMNEPGRFFGYGGIGLIKSASTTLERLSNGDGGPIRIKDTQDHNPGA